MYTSAHICFFSAMCHYVELNYALVDYEHVIELLSRETFHSSAISLTLTPLERRQPREVSRSAVGRLISHM
jgi:hypothetical protein